MADMDVNVQGLREAAVAYFENLPPTKKYEISEPFRREANDTNGNSGTTERVSIRKIQQFDIFQGAAPSSSTSSHVVRRFLEKFVDTNGDGKLDFVGYKTFFYLEKSGRTKLISEGGHGVCDGHGCDSYCLTGGLYFVCVDCFDDPNKEEGFNLCTSCYSGGRYAHRHQNFLDNFVLLCSKFVRKSTVLTIVPKTPQVQIDPMMEKIRSTALAYYENLSRGNKEEALKFFSEMSINGVSWAISLEQYENKFGSSSRMKKCFDMVDINGDGWLDFHEFVTLYYLHKSGRLRVRCYGYGCDEAPFLKGAFFVCVDCFKKHIHFYLCTFCYRYGNHTHSRRHTNFVDNCMLLQDLILPPYTPDQPQTAVVPSQPGALVVATQSLSLLSNMVNLGTAVGGLIGCNIL